jgi:hypothetical protein
MAYDDNNCACGGKKERDTLMCVACKEETSHYKEWGVYLDDRYSTEPRRSAAIMLLAAARRRGNRAKAA